MPFAEGSIDLQRCQSSSFENRDNNFGWHAFIVDSMTKSSQHFPRYTCYRRFPNRKSKVLTPPPPINHTPRLAESLGTVHTNINPGGVLFAIIFSIWAWNWEFQLTAPFSWMIVNKHISRITRLAWKIPIAPCHHMSGSGMQNRLFLEDLENGTCKFTWNSR